MSKKTADMSYGMFDVKCGLTFDLTENNINDKPQIVFQQYVLLNYNLSVSLIIDKSVKLHTKRNC